MMTIIYKFGEAVSPQGQPAMKVSRSQATRNRERIIETAAQRFRERGFDGIGIADLMKDVGLTHGGFYGNFSSKDDLIAEASSRALAQTLARWSAVAESAPTELLSSIADIYLSIEHRDDPGTGCLLAAVGPDLSRQAPIVRRVTTDAVRSALDFLAERLPGPSRAARRQKAISAYATMLGTMIMSRAVDDPQLSQEILDAGRASVKP